MAPCFHNSLWTSGSLLRAGVWPARFRGFRWPAGTLGSSPESVDTHSSRLVFMTSSETLGGGSPAASGGGRVAPLRRRQSRPPPSTDWPATNSPRTRTRCRRCRRSWRPSRGSQISTVTPTRSAAGSARRSRNSWRFPRTDIVTGAGSLGALNQILAAFAGQNDDGKADEVIYAWRSFEAYPISVGLAGAESVRIPVTAGRPARPRRHGGRRHRPDQRDPALHAQQPHRTRLASRRNRGLRPYGAGQRGGGR